MVLKQKIKSFPRFYGFLLTILNGVGYFEKRFHYFFPKYQPTYFWQKRISLVQSSPDNEKIKVVPGARKIFPDYQLMHNGLKITLGSYYDYGNTLLLQKNKGIHEPQEEYVFQEVLKFMPKKAIMMELGSFWSFYSMWFTSSVEGAKAIMVEPDPHKMNFGKLNFKLNDLKGVFDPGFISDHTDLTSSIPNYSVDYLMEKHRIDFLDILHSDIQGYELKMLQGAFKTLKEKKVGFDLNEAYSWDGVLVAQNEQQVAKIKTEISKRK